MKYYYHATPAENLPDILRDGLKPGCLGCVCMTEHPDEAPRFPAIETQAAEIITLKIKTLKADEPNIQETFDHDQNFWQCRCFGYYGTIPPERIEPVTIWRRPKDMYWDNDEGKG